MNIVLIGMKGCGKTTLGRLLAKKLQLTFIDSDTAIEQMHRQEKGEALLFREIFKRYGEAYFSALETRTLQHIAQTCETTKIALACGGQTPLREKNQQILSGLGTIIYLQVSEPVLLKRILAHGVPAFFPYPDDPEKSLHELLAQRLPVYKKLAHITVDVSAGTPDEAVHTILTELRYDEH
ncbi:MAG TPA: shikimate kinase [Ktedonobacteraceae bacterium]|jgi:shikimate kinase